MHIECTGNICKAHIVLLESGLKKRFFLLCSVYKVVNKVSKVSIIDLSSLLFKFFY